jgi:hypothetical protein
VLEQLDLVGKEPLSLTSLGIALLVGFVLSLGIRWHFRNFGSTLSNREEFAQVFPFVLLTTILIISVVKSSLALSLGLVGALSVVRFRTPIKEPEELAYLFLCIAVGLGLGANQFLPTIVATVAILGVMAFVRSSKARQPGKNLFLSLDGENQADEAMEATIARINDILGQRAQKADLRRLDVRESRFDATYLVDLASPEDLNQTIADLRQAFPALGITFLDQKQLPSV